MKVEFGPVPLVYPIPIVLTGANVGGRANFATLGDCGVMGLKPPWSTFRCTGTTTPPGASTRTAPSV